MSPQLTLYGANYCPHTERVELALKEGNIPYNYYFIDLTNKPAFFTERINPNGRVPVITYGGPSALPTKPSPLSTKLAESTVILEFLADTYPEARLMPTDPLQRAKVRFFMDAVVRKYFPAYMDWALDHVPQAMESHLKAIELIQGLLSDSGVYAVGDGYTIADACITPFILRLQLAIENDIGKYPRGNGRKFGELLKDPRYAKFMAYTRAVTARPVVKRIWDSKKGVVKQVWIAMLDRESTYEVPLEYVNGRT